jgi:hypothetical protein
MSEATPRFWWVRHALVVYGGRIYGRLALLRLLPVTPLFARLAAAIAA